MEKKSSDSYPLVSIVMCTYNGGKFIKEQMDSLLKQTYPNLEIIITDDCSTDNSYSLLQEYAAIDKRIQLHRNEVNQGYTLNFGNTCKLATGEYIAISDQDDVWLPEKIKTMMDKWVPGVQLMYCNSRRFYTDEIPWGIKPLRLYRRFEGKDSRRLAVYNTISGHALLVKREFLHSLLPFPKKLMYDWWAGAVAANNGGVGYVHDILVFQRVHGNNVSVISDWSENKKKYKDESNEMVNNHLAAFATIKNMPDKHRKFYQELSVLWKEAMTQKFSWDLFKFLVLHRKSIFHYKKRMIGIVSHIKHSYYLAKNY